MKKTCENSLSSGNGEKNFDSDIANRVFDLELLRDKILNYVISDKKNLVIDNIRCCRLVNKLWLQSVSRILCKRNEPLFRFHLHHENSISGTSYVQKYRKLHNQFLKSINRGVDKCVPTHVIRAACAFFRQENYNGFYRYLMEGGGSLVELDVTFVDQDQFKPMTLNFPNLSLPKLVSLTVSFYDVVTTSHSYMPPSAYYTSGYCGYNSNNKIDFIQSVFDASEQLQKFQFQYSCSQIVVPNNFNNLRLPLSLEQIDLDCLLSDSSLGVLVRGPLPNLKVLKLRINDVPFKQGMLTSILENVQKTLQVFHVKDNNQQSRNKRPNIFQLPHMEKLECLTIETCYLEVKGGFALQHAVPALKQMTLTLQTSAMFQIWTAQSCFHSVKSLTASLGSSDYFNRRQRFSANRLVNLDVNTLASFKSAFPNLEELSIILHTTEIPALKYVFSEMRYLQQLRVVIQDVEDIANADVWDALLTGIPQERVSALRDSPALWKKLVVTSNSNASIRKMTCLHTLHLESFMGRDVHLISEVAFNYAFLMMPKLHKLILEGNFVAPGEMETRWNKKVDVIQKKR